ncbi:MAG TPA: EAL domain-containing protein [Acidobacteriaceae bacterium]|nr:EAL domain-containing protein [Acidobacteriaceae bacterium]
MVRRSAARYRLVTIVMPAIATVILCVSSWQLSAFSRHNSIEQLAKMPANSAVHLIGVVVHIDPSRGEVWLQDESGAVPLMLGKSGAEARLNEAVAVDGRIGKLTRPGASRGNSPAAQDRVRRPGRRAGLRAHREAAHQSQAGSLAAGTGDQDERLALENAAPGLAVQVAGIQALYAGWTLLALPTVIFVPLWLVVLYLRIRGQSKELVQASQTGEAIRELSMEVERVTREATFNSEILEPGDPEVAPLAAGFNAMVAELRKRDGVTRDAELRLGRMTLMDNLTGLPNRRLLADRLSQCLGKAKGDDDRLLGLLCIDLDDFKLINDTYGHAVGDALLGQVAQRLKTQFRYCETVARIGGDEFAMILGDLGTREEAYAQAEEVRHALRAAFEIGTYRVQTGARIGISIFPDAQGADELLQQAEYAMYAAKRGGRQRVVRFGDGLGIGAREQLTLGRELENALANGEISLDYQPEVDLATNRITRFEALARWKHPELGMILPAVFIPLAEEAGVISALGSYIMERACTDAATWQEIAGRPVQVAVNVSSFQFGGETFFEEVAEILQRTGLEPHLLQIELTESATLDGMERAAELMRRLKSLGVSVAVDDFGTGYSCLTYLPKLPFDTLKLDRSFVSEMMTRRETKALVGSIVTLARDLDMKVIAEGIETQEQLRALRAMGSDAGQGFLLGRPSGDPVALLSMEVTA